MTGNTGVGPAARRHFAITFDPAVIEQPIPRRFDEMAAACPDNLAVQFGSDRLTYSQLRALSESLAAALSSIGAAPGDRAGVLFRVGVKPLPAMIGILRAGLAFVPLDSSQPRERLSHIFSDSGARTIVTDDLHLPLARELGGPSAEILNLDRLPSPPPDFSPQRIDPSALAFILFTSGSTGKPKGVMYAHRNLLYSATLHYGVADIGPGHRTLCLPSFAFAGAVLGMFRAALNGATAFITEVERLNKLADVLSSERITHASMSPSMLRRFLATLTGRESFPLLVRLSVGSEPLRWDDVRKYRQLLPAGPPLFNGYGSTETAAGCCFTNVDDAPEGYGDFVPVGYPVGDAEIRIFDEDRQSLPIGAEGEIGVTSRYLSLGYWNRPDLTAKAFLPDPSGGDRRTYLTGDMGRKLDNGCIAFLGRRDFQVKISGFRVEFAEIEGALRDLPHIKDAVVAAPLGDYGEPRIVAYFIPEKGFSPTVSSLRRELSHTLPKYMVPSAFVKLDSFPLTLNGKVDRSALPPPGKGRPNLDAPFLAPRTPIERAIALIWTDVLKLEEVGVNDNFLELGGHSLLATQIASRILNEFQVDIPLQELFDAPTVAEASVLVARYLAESRAADVEVMLSRLEAESPPPRQGQS